MTATTLSAQGQVAIPQQLRDARNWRPGMALEVEEWPQGLLIRPASEKFFATSSVESVMGSAGYDGPPLTDEQIDQALNADIQRAGGER